MPSGGFSVCNFAQTRLETPTPRRGPVALFLLSALKQAAGVHKHPLRSADQRYLCIGGICSIQESQCPSLFTLDGFRAPFCLLRICSLLNEWERRGYYVGKFSRKCHRIWRKLLAKGGAGGEIVVAYAISITSGPSNKGGGDEWRKYVPLIFALRAKADTRSIVN